MKAKRILTTLASLLLLALATASAGEGDSRTLTGSYRWDQRGSSGDLQAVFTPTDKADEWTVDFHFDFRGKPHTYSGTATGSLDSGGLRGRVRNENRGRTFTFRGTVQDGKFRGTHAEVKGGNTIETGSLDLEG
jgi:hypothetical protein